MRVILYVFASHCNVQHAQWELSFSQIRLLRVHTVTLEAHPLAALCPGFVHLQTP